MGDIGGEIGRAGVRLAFGESNSKPCRWESCNGAGSLLSVGDEAPQPRRDMCNPGSKFCAIIPDAFATVVSKLSRRSLVRWVDNDPLVSSGVRLPLGVIL